MDHHKCFKGIVEFSYGVLITAERMCIDMAERRSDEGSVPLHPHRLRFPLRIQDVPKAFIVGGNRPEHVNNVSPIL